jgi:hypothetical protein
MSGGASRSGATSPEIGYSHKKHKAENQEASSPLGAV